jgi:hypothetical protein
VACGNKTKGAQHTQMLSQVRHYRGADGQGGAGCGVKTVMLTINSCEQKVGRKGGGGGMEGSEGRK